MRDFRLFVIFFHLWWAHYRRLVIERRIARLQGECHALGHAFRDRFCDACGYERPLSDIEKIDRMFADTTNLARVLRKARQ